MKQCRSLHRAIRRGHPVNINSGTYKSKKESRIMKEIWEAALRKQAIEDAQNNTNDEQEN
jgi:hypothetical protein